MATVEQFYMAMEVLFSEALCYQQEIFFVIFLVLTNGFSTSPFFEFYINNLDYG